MKFGTGLLISCAIALLAGCAGPERANITAAPVTASFVKSLPAERIAEDTTELEVRSFLPDESGKAFGAEVVGAVCTISSDELRAEVVTPQVVILPSFEQKKAFDDRGLPGSLAVRCRQGGSSGSALITAQQREVTTVTGGGLVVALISTAVTAAAANTAPWEFPATAYVKMTAQ